MSSTATQRLRLDKQATGDNPNAWGVRLNAALDLIDESQGLQVVPISAAVVLTSNNFSSDQSRRMVLKLTGAGGFSVTIPQVEKAYFVHNTCSAPVTMKTALDAGVAIQPNVFRWVYCDGNSVFGDITLAAGEAAAAANLAAQQAAASAAAAATFDPSTFYTKVASDTRFAPAIAYPTLDDVRTLAIQLAKLKGTTVGMAAGIVDDFKDQTGVDTAVSTNFVYDGTANTIGNYQPATDDLPVMTSNTAPSGQTAVASDETYAQAYRAYDGGATTTWSVQSQSGSIYRTSSVSRVEAQYAITFYDGSADTLRAPRTWTRWGSNNGGTTKVTIDTQASQINWINGERRLFTIPTGNRASYTTYGFSFTNNNGTNFTVISSIESLLAVPADLDLRSIAFTAQAVPSKGSFFILVKSATAAAIVANTNLLAKLSRDGGTTYTTATLTSTGALSTGYTIFEANGFDISPQPSGSSMKWRVQTAGATLNILIDAIVAQWG